MARAGRKRKLKPREPSGRIKKSAREPLKYRVQVIDDITFDSDLKHIGQGYPTFTWQGKLVHLHIFVWEYVHGPRPKGVHIHHKDGNTWNWQIENLEAISPSDHKRLHSGWVRTDGEWTHKPCGFCKQVKPLVEFHPRRSKGGSGYCRPCTAESQRKWRAQRAEQKTAQVQGVQHG